MCDKKMKTAIFNFLPKRIQNKIKTYIIQARNDGSIGSLMHCPLSKNIQINRSASLGDDIFINSHLKIRENSEIGSKCSIRGDEMLVGKNSFINENCDVNATLEVGNFTSIGRSVKFEGNNHNMKKQLLLSELPATIDP